MQTPLRVITAAVTPVVMITSTAILIGGIANRHTSLSDRTRQLAAEFRNPGTSLERRRNIEAQIAIFHQRLLYTRRAHLWLHFSIACFIAMTIVIGLTTISATWSTVALPIFVLGVGLMLASIILAAIELRLSSRTIDLETCNLTPNGPRL
jgi:hypothetical protein